MGTISKLLSGTAVLVGLYLIIAYSKGTARVINSLGSTYTNAVRSLQGR